MSQSVYASAFWRAMRPDPHIPIDEWSDTYRILPSESSAEPGKYRTDRMPYLREIARELSPQSVAQRISVVKGTQLGFTELANNMIFTYADLYPCPMLLILPTESLAMTHAKDKLWPSVDKTPRIVQKVYPRKKDGGSSVMDVRFPGGNLKIAYAFTTSTFASVSRRIVIKDDLDRWPDDVKGEGNPSVLADKRADAFRNKKIYANSSPTLKGVSKIWREFDDGSQALFNMPCPVCGERFAFEREYFQYEWDEKHYKLTSDVVCVCPHCHTSIEEGKKYKMMQTGEWEHLYPERTHKSYRLPSYYSPFLSWKEIFQEYLGALKAKDAGSAMDMVAWTNTRDAKVWEEEIEATEHTEILRLKVATEEALVPEDTILMTMSVDVQKDHFWVEVLAHLSGGRKHTVYAGRVEEWTQVEELVYDDWSGVGGGVYRVRVCGVDAGYRTDEVYDFCATNYPICIPIKGVDSNAMTNPWRIGTVKMKKNGKRIATGMKLYGLNVLYFKDMTDSLIRRSLVAAESGELEETDGVLTLNVRCDEEFARQLTSEYPVEEVSKKTGKVTRYWKKRPSVRDNHLWDCTVYNIFLGEVLGVRRLKPEKKASQNKRRVLSKGVRR